MAVYTVIGHPINLGDLGLANAAAVHDALQAAGVGKTVTLVLSGPDDTKLKGHVALQ